MNKVGDVAQLVVQLSMHEKGTGSTPLISNYYFLLTYLPRLDKFKIICSGKLNTNGDVAQLVERLSMHEKGTPRISNCYFLLIYLQRSNKI